LYSPSRAFLRALPFGPAFPTLPDPFPYPISSALSRFPLPRFPFRRVRLYQNLSDLISSVLSRFSLSRFPFRRLRLYQKHLGRIDRRPFLNHQEGLLLNRRIDCFEKRADSKPPPPDMSSSRQLFKSTSPLDPCQRVFWGEEETSRSAGAHAHQAAVGTVALRSDAATSPVSPDRAARPPRT
jgi:hypothetical protein